MTTDQLYGRTIDARASVTPDAAAVEAFGRPDLQTRGTFDANAGRAYVKVSMALGTRWMGFYRDGVATFSSDFAIALAMT